MLMIAGCRDLVAVNHDAEADRELWVAARAAGLGGSEIAAIVGESSMKSAIDVWLEKTGARVENIDNTRTRVGRLLEPVLLDWYARGNPFWDRTGGAVHVAKPPTCYHASRPWQRGSPDGFVYEPEQVVAIGPGVDLIKSPVKPAYLLEIKTHGWFMSRAYDATDDDGNPITVPSDKRIQCAWYMELFDIDHARLCALTDTHVQRTYDIPRDREVGAYLLEEGERFWNRNVLGGVAPDPDGSKSFRRYLSDKFKTHGVQLVTSTDAIDETTRKLLRVKRATKRLEKLQEQHEQVIKNHIGNAMGVKTIHGDITWKLQRSGKLKEKDARAELYAVAGYTDAEIASFETKHAQPAHRVMRTPK